MYNRIILIGRLTRDPELRYVPSGAPVANFTLAVDRPFRDQQGNRETDFIDIVAWRKLAEQVSQYMTKGRMVAVEGRLQLRSYETQDGQKRKVAEVVADGIRFLDRGRPGMAETATAAATAAAAAPASSTADEAAQGSSDEDVPF
ncbi:MAG: single-stranded DNA-binding protein [Bacillati bacterium ANGP1]|uniref:Single-stranded DNA-binding protein n=1 Tax=Candidatus Segetimicrobium genomatis TaxID=2569760 RepID=A0A537K3Z2_9BACT|nr:MAG: single-stranded DNA-binding protein [Terrabacteria group bacterium ANGP1]